MPTLDWIGKNKVINHHQEVPYRILERQYSFDENGQHAEDNGSPNMIIHGDNLEALKSLLPRYEGRIKCIYIDPPYNTGNEGWVYNDNVNDPKIRKWLGEVVGKEGEDLSRHDKWLCMMYPRLMLLYKLLAEDGVIFISIDDMELSNLRLVLNEIMGAGNFVADISWQRTYSTRNDSKGIVSEVEHILVYSKSPNWSPNKLERTAEMESIYKNPDNDCAPWTSGDPCATGGADHQGMVYGIQHPFTGKMLYPSSNAHWRYQQETLLEIMNGWANYELKDIDDAEERARVCGLAPSEVRTGIKAIVLCEPVEEAAKKAQAVYDRGQWPRYFFTKGGKGGIRRKTYRKDVGGRVPTNLWMYEEVGHTDEAKKELLAIFGGNATFDTPKPTRVIEHVLKIAGDKDTLILDSFAGSGTTAHAVLKMNQADQGSRRFILVEMGDYAEATTAERMKRVIQGYGKGKKQIPGTGGNFSFYELGAPLLTSEGYLNEAVGVERIREYMWYMETRSDLPKEGNGNPHYLGTSNSTSYYFYYQPGESTALDYDFLETIPERTESIVIYADRCHLSEKELTRFGITFKKIPRDITKL